MSNVGPVIDLLHCRELHINSAVTGGGEHIDESELNLYFMNTKSHQPLGVLRLTKRQFEQVVFEGMKLLSRHSKAIEDFEGKSKWEE